ncbi:PBP1A family penicillin-binding protein [Bacillaceae bacterium IKA-2]|nr:PBP1A family penicillin-binding protein [Bacillaceae bacterium IKA-2]
MMSEDNHTREGRRKTKETNQKGKTSQKAIIKKLLIAFSVFFIIVMIAGAITVFSMIKSAPPLDPEKLLLNSNVEIYEQNDEFWTTLSASESRTLVAIQDVPQLLEDAFISVEDVRFRDHFGLDIRRIGGAILANVSGGFGAEGASTITQQVVKNLFLSSDKKLTRKIQEQYLAIKLEQMYTKDEILEMYLNAIYFSEGAWGAVVASDRYFSKTLDELNIEDAALLAGIPQRPNFFNPFKNPEEAEKRRNIVISLMERHGKITATEASDAKAVAVVDQLKRSDKEDYPHRAFLDYIVNEAIEIEGISAADIYAGGLKIYTTLDLEAQSIAENILHSEELINYPDELFQAGFTVIDTKTGEIRAIGGGRQNEDIQRGYSWATDPKRQPGSTIKPILDYGPAIEHLKWSTYQQITDEPHQYNDTENTKISNFNNEHAGNVSMRYALQKSINIPAVKAFQAVGIKNATQFGEGLGIPLESIQESYSLGGFETGFSTLELAGAYAAFGNEGTYHKPYAIRKIVFPDGRTIDLAPEPHQAMSDYTAFMVSDMLKSAVSSNGTGNRARVEGLPMAGKTGTSNFSPEDKERFNIDNGAKDIWFAGYTSNYTIAVWTGYDTPNDGYIKYDGSEHIAKDIFKHVMTEISKGKTTDDFIQPSSVVKVGIEKASGLLPSQYTPQSEIIYEYFVKGTEPTETSVLHIKPPTPTGFMGAYDEDGDQILLSWSYPDEERQNYAFELQFSVNDSKFEVISSQEEMQHIIFNPEKDATYRFKLQAVSTKNNQLRSDVRELSIKVPEDEEEKEREKEEARIEKEKEEEEEEKEREEKEREEKEKEKARKEREKEEARKEREDGEDNDNEIPDPLEDLEPEPEPDPEPAENN